MSPLSVDQAAQLAQDQSGIPAIIAKVLIQLEGSWDGSDWHNGQIVNNPFDVTAEWAQLAGYGGNVTGQGGTQGNIASFDDPANAVKAWAYGMLNFSNYAGVRAVLTNTQATAMDFFDALGKTGYDAGNPLFAGALGNVYRFLTGLDPTRVLLGGKPLPNPTNPPTTITTGPTTAPSNDTTSQPSAIPDTIVIQLPFGQSASLPNPLKPFEVAVQQAQQLATTVVKDVERFGFILIGLIVATVGLWLLVRSEENNG